MWKWILGWLCSLLVPFALACDTGSGVDPVAEDLSPAGPRRTFDMGFSAFPAENTSDGYRDVFETAGRYGETVLIQRPVAWEDFALGSSISDRLQDTTKLDMGLAHRNGLDIALAIDPTDPRDRHRLAPLPEALRGKNFGSQDMQRAYLGYVRYMAANYRPKYMALAVDVNLLAGGNPAEFERFLPVYRQGYDIVKEVSPDTKVFVTFQYEDLLGQIPWNKHQPDWSTVDKFGGKLDLFAISTYPSLLDAAIQDLPETYYLQIEQHTSLPIGVMDMGYSSGPGVGGLNAGSEAEQARFLLTIFGAADRLRMQFLIWFAASDPKYVLDPPLDAYATIGLRAADGKLKAGWSIWVQNLRRPYGEGSTDKPAETPKRRNPITTVEPQDRRPVDQRDPFRSSPTPVGSPSVTPIPAVTTTAGASPSGTPTGTLTPGVRATPTPIS